MFVVGGSASPVTLAKTGGSSHRRRSGGLGRSGLHLSGAPFEAS